MKIRKKILGILLALTVACCTLIPTTGPVYADEENYTDTNSNEDAATDNNLKEMLIFYSGNDVLPAEFFTTNFSKKSKTFKNIFHIYTEAADSDEHLSPTYTYQVTKADKGLAFDNNTLTIKKGIKAGTHKIEIKVTAQLEGYKSTSTTMEITVKIKKPRTSANVTYKVGSGEYKSISIPIDVTGTYKVSISGLGAKLVEVSLYQYGDTKTLRNGQKVKINPNLGHLSFIGKDYLAGNYSKNKKGKITIKLKKVS